MGNGTVAIIFQFFLHTKLLQFFTSIFFFFWFWRILINTNLASDVHRKLQLIWSHHKFFATNMHVSCNADDGDGFSMAIATMIIQQRWQR